MNGRTKYIFIRNGRSFSKIQNRFKTAFKSRIYLPTETADTKSRGYSSITVAPS